ncbi:fumarylacetoacetate hydrolase family protein [Streptosporangium fragile]|uniref:Fumarylacetoacetate hydrolase family protein n=1 Tax=Streptosporangium fragile TaxID=46186 RepID=A0ABN3VS73_9ACTN
MSRVVRYRRSDGRPRWGVLSADGERVHELAGGPHPMGTPGEASEPTASIEIMAPVRPSTIACVGLNHGLTRAALDRPASRQPMIFLKSPGSVTGPNSSIECPPGADVLDVAGELAVVMGRRARRVAEHEAMSHVLGFTCANDVGVRDWLTSDSQWFRAKSSDTFCPLGPWITTGLGDPDAASITLAVNGEKRQSGSMAELTWKIPQIISYASSYVTFEPGDVILMGSPAGLAAASPGDTVEVTIEGIGTLVNTVTAPHEARRTVL